MGFFAASLALALVVAAVSSQAQTLERIDIVGHGVYALDTGAAAPVAGAPTGAVTSVDGMRNLEATREVKAAPGVEFGLEYLIVGAPEGADVALDFVVRYPPVGLQDPAQAAPIHETRYTKAKSIGQTHYLGYGLEAEWEMVPGDWSFEIWSGERRLASESFSVAP